MTNGGKMNTALCYCHHHIYYNHISIYASCYCHHHIVINICVSVATTYVQREYQNHVSEVYEHSDMDWTYG